MNNLEEREPEIKESGHYDPSNKLKEDTPDSIFHRAQILLKNESKWCQNSVAINRNGEKVSALHKDAVAWDIYGAIMKTCNQYRPDLLIKTLDYLETLNLGKFSSIIDLNDYGTHSDVYWLLSKAAIDYKLWKKRVNS